MIQPVIIAGGKGVRLWPVSRETLPKPYVNIGIGTDTLLQATLRRLQGLDDCAAPLVVCGLSHEALVREQSQAIVDGGVGLVLEPAGRNTAPAICAAALAITAMGLGDDPMLVLPADHVIEKLDAFADAVRRGADLARRGLLVTFAISPTYAATGYGYLKLGPPIDGGPGLHKLAAFIEKPDVQRAAAFLAEGGYAWNSGMFLFRPSVVLAAFAELAPEILAACQASLAVDARDRRMLLDGGAFAAAPSTSIDYAIMERAGNVATVVADLGWSDVGDWQAIWDIAPKDEAGNALSGDALVVDSRDSLLHSEGPLLVGIGLDSMVAVATPDAVVVAARSRSQDVKLAVDRLVAQKRREPVAGRKVTAPWGSRELLHGGDDFEVIAITIDPGFDMTLPSSGTSKAHLVVTAGKGRATSVGAPVALAAGVHVDFSRDVAYVLANTGTLPLVLIAIRMGGGAVGDWQSVSAGG
jgi:mannose-1-phosphate guanylyltransferase/mannose-6-phosphate isomerase